MKALTSIEWASGGTVRSATIAPGADPETLAREALDAGYGRGYEVGAAAALDLAADLILQARERDRSLILRDRSGKVIGTERRREWIVPKLTAFARSRKA